MINNKLIITILICFILINNLPTISIKKNQNSKSSFIDQSYDSFEITRTNKKHINNNNNIHKPKKKNSRKNINIIAAYLMFASKKKKF
jgi:hypothetical protein